MTRPEKIEKKHLILCEGSDAVGFINNYLYSQCRERCNEIQVANFGGNPDLRKFLELLRVTPGFSDLHSLLIIRDAEKDIRSALDQVRFALKDYHFAMPKTQGEWEDGTPRTCFLLFPALGREIEAGTLEDLCMSILAEPEVDKVTDRVDCFLDTLRQDGLRHFAYLHKTKLHTYFSVTNNFVTKNVGVAAKAGAFNWSHPNLDPLKDCLSKMEGE
mgnify:CR=1 FL=1